MTKLHVFVAVALAALLVVLTVFVFRGSNDTPEPPEAFSPVPLPEVEPEEELVVSEPEEPAEPDEGAVEELVVEEEAPPEEEPEPLPVLNDSDTYVYEQLSSLENPSSLLQQLASGQLVRKFVVLVDNASRGDMPARDLPLLGPSSELQAREVDLENYEMLPSSYDRFDELVQIMTAVDTEQAVALYAQMSPLFEEAYAELGYGDRRFEEALSSALDEVLQAEVGNGTYELTRPSVHYEYADPELEERSSVEKLLIRMGPENAAALQAKLRELKTALNL